MANSPEEYTIPEVNRKELLPQHDLDMLLEIANGAGSEEWIAGLDDFSGKTDYNAGGYVSARKDWSTYGQRIVIAGGRNEKGYRYGVLREQDQVYIAMFDPPTVTKLLKSYQQLLQYYIQREKQAVVDAKRKKSTTTYTEE